MPDNSTLTRAIADLIREGRELKRDDRTVAELILVELENLDVLSDRGDW